MFRVTESFLTVTQVEIVYSPFNGRMLSWIGDIIMTLNRIAIIEELFRLAPNLLSEDDCAENIVIPLLLRLGYDRSQIQRKVSISSDDGKKFKKQADIVIYIDKTPAAVIETKRLRHKLRGEDANQALSYAQLLDPPAPIAILTNGQNWELYKLLDDSIGGLEDVPEPVDLQSIVSSYRGRAIEPGRREAAERLLLTLENKDKLIEAFEKCRQALLKEGLIAESAFDELTKILVCKFNEEKRFAEGLSIYRFSSRWLLGTGALAGLCEMFADAKTKFNVFPPNTQIQIKSNETAKDIVEALEGFGFYGFKTPVGLAGAGGDIVGSVYETFLVGTLRGDLGQYLTPRQLVEFMVEMADIQIGENVLDLTCGSGGFIIRAFTEVKKLINALKVDKKNKDILVNDLVTNHLWGVDINPRLATLCRINMILHGDGYEHIYNGDAISEDVFQNSNGRRFDFSSIESGELSKFDVILMNPPFNLPYENAHVLNRYDLGRSKSAQGSDYLLLERAIRLLKENSGRLIIIMPHGIASGVSENDIRGFINGKARIKGCISLPVGAFKPFGGSNARTCILILMKEEKSNKRRFLAQAEQLGYDITTKNYREIEANDLLEISDQYSNQKKVETKIQLLSDTPLILTIDEEEASLIDTIDVGAAYTSLLHSLGSAFEEKRLGDYVDIVANSISPSGRKYTNQAFEYVDLREVDEIYGSILKTRILKGNEIGSSKYRFQKWDILFAKIMPSLANKKIALVTQDVTNPIASTEFIILRKKPNADISLYYLFRALRSDHFTRQVVANVTGDTGRQRISPTKLLEFKIIVPPKELQDKIGIETEKEFSLRTLACEQAKLVDDEASLVLGRTTLRIDKLASSASKRLKNK